MVWASIGVKSRILTFLTLKTGHVDERVSLHEARTQRDFHLELQGSQLLQGSELGWKESHGQTDPVSMCLSAEEFKYVQRTIPPLAVMDPYFCLE